MTTIEAPPEIDPGVEDDAAYLDQIYPGWYEKVNLGMLNLASTSGCVLGQVYGDYGSAPTDVFTRPGRLPGRFADRQFEPSWREAILRRRA